MDNAEDNIGELGMKRRADDANVVDFPPPVSNGQKLWERCLAAQLRAHLPEDQDEARQIVAIMAGAIDRSEGQRSWEQRRLAAYILSMFPDDQVTARRIVSLLFCPDDAA